MQEHQERLADALAGCAKGDRNALRTIFELEGARLVAVAQRILRRRELAEDVVQEAFIQIWTKAGQYAPDRGSARGWIYAIARNRALNLVRDGKRLEFTEPDNLADLHDAEHMDHAANVWADLDRQNRLRECLSRLDETKRRSILMVYMSGYTHGEIAGRLKVPLGHRQGLGSPRVGLASGVHGMSADRQDIDELADEYVLGLLDAADHAHVESQIEIDAALRAAVRRKPRPFPGARSAGKAGFRAGRPVGPYRGNAR